jgi:hypothetical protein
VVEEVNKAAVTHAESCRSYALTEAEVAAAEAGTLDIITGFQVCVCHTCVCVCVVPGGLSQPRAVLVQL